MIQHEEIKKLCFEYNKRCYNFFTLNYFAENWKENSFEFDSLSIFRIFNKKSLIKANLSCEKYIFFKTKFKVFLMIYKRKIFMVFPILNQQNKKYVDENLSIIFRNMNNVLNCQVTFFFKSDF